MDAEQPVQDGSDEAGIAFEEPAQFSDALARATVDVDAGIPHALIVVKLAHVAEVRRECGEDAETALFHVVGHALHHQVGADVRATRLEADRLAVLKPRCLPRDAHALGKRVRVALEGGQFLWRGLCFRLGAYVGVLEMTDQSVLPADQVAKAARASDAAESLGGDGVVVTSGRPEEQIALEREREWRDHLSEVI